jgi:hypothetical protein
MNDYNTVRRRTADEVYRKLAFVSAAIWACGTLLLFIAFAAGNPRPIPMAAMSMTVPLLPAAFVWLLYRPLTVWLTARRLHQADPAARGG